MHFEKAKKWGSIALLVTLINGILIGILFIDTLFQVWFTSSIYYLVIFSCASIPIGLIANYYHKTLQDNISDYTYLYQCIFTNSTNNIFVYRYKRILRNLQIG